MNLDVMMAVAGTLLMLCVYANRHLDALRHPQPVIIPQPRHARRKRRAPASSFIMPG